MSVPLQKLTTKVEVDSVIQKTEDLVLVLRFGRDTDLTCMQLDDIVSVTSVLKCSVEVFEAVWVATMSFSLLGLLRRGLAKIQYCTRL